MDNLKIRRLTPDDMDQWFTVRIEALKDSPTAFLASPEKELDQGVEFFRSRIIDGGHQNLIFGCFDQSILVGTIGLVKEGHAKASHKAFIWGMYVQANYRRQQVGKGLLQKAIEFAKVQMKVEQVTLSVESSRVPAKKLYSSLGFEKWGTEPKAIFVNGSYYDEDYMKLMLK